ncbi:Unknown protein sequence [Pseudomonas savastanoi pv. phaseolicola]|nr:Unknown protein sequence [Pseudomonas amygdali pv. mellea]KPB66733.1 Unknown protein sequence [Pseudomonas savastanoi pv. phaseolicola]
MEHYPCISKGQTWLGHANISTTGTLRSMQSAVEECANV